MAMMIYDKNLEEFVIHLFVVFFNMPTLVYNAHLSNMKWHSTRNDLSLARLRTIFFHLFSLSYSR